MGLEPLAGDPSPDGADCVACGRCCHHGPRTVHLLVSDDARVLASAGGEEGSLIYVARFRREDLGALRQLLSGCTSTLVYSWQPEVLRHHLRGPQVELRAVPKTLAERYGVRL